MDFKTPPRVPVLAGAGSAIAEGRLFSVGGVFYYDTGAALVPITARLLADNAVTNAYLRDSSALSVIGRSANSSGDPADISAGTDGHVLRRSGTTLGFGTIATAGIADAAVTLAKQANLANARLIGRATSGTGVPEALTLSQVLDFIGSAARGDVLVRGASTWARLAAGADGSHLRAAGAGADLAWSLHGTFDTSTFRHTAAGNISGSQTLNASVSNVMSGTATGTITWTFSGAPASGFARFIVLELTNGGAYTMTWPASVKWPGGVAPTLTASGVDVLVFVTDDAGTTWRGVLSMAASA